MDIIKMHITMRPDYNPNCSQTISSSPQASRFSKTENKNPLDTGMIHKKHVPMGKPYHGHQKAHP